MIGRAGQDGMGAINLLEGHDQGHFVLEGKGTERPEQVGRLLRPGNEKVDLDQDDRSAGRSSDKR